MLMLVLVKSGFGFDARLGILVEIEFDETLIDFLSIWILAFGL